jgi:peptidoglycan biosynthesis protein MviN/MurJ (putative lipid II flippase)
MKDSTATYLFFTRDGEHQGTDIASITHMRLGSKGVVLCFAILLVLFTYVAQASSVLSTGTGLLLSGLTTTLLFATTLFLIIVRHRCVMLQSDFKASEAQSDEERIAVLVNAQSRLLRLAPYLKGVVFHALVGVLMTWYYVGNGAWSPLLFASIVVFVGYVCHLIKRDFTSASSLMGAINMRLVTTPEGMRDDDMMMGLAWTLNELDHQAHYGAHHTE